MQFELVRAQDSEGHIRSLVVPPAALDDTLVQICEHEGIQLSVQDSRMLSDDTSSNFNCLLEADQMMRMCITISELQRGFSCIYRDAVRLSRNRIQDSSFMLSKESNIPQENPAPLADDSDAVLGWLERNAAFSIVNSPTRGLRYAAYPRDYYDAFAKLLEDTIETLVHCMKNAHDKN